MAEQTAALAVPEADDDEALAIVVEAEELVVDSQVSFEYAATQRRVVKDMIATIEGKWKPLKQAQDAAKGKLLEQERSELSMPKKVLEIINDKLAAYETQQRRERAIAEARAAEEARQIEAARPKPPPGAPPPMPVVVPAAPVEMPKVQGLSFTPHYDVVEDVDKGGRMALIEAVAGVETDRATGKVKLVPKWGSAMVMEPNMPMLKDMARQAKGDIKIPGYKVVETRRPRG